MSAERESAPTSALKPASAPSSDASAGQGGQRAARRSVHAVANNPMRWVRLCIQAAFLVFAPQAFSAAFAGARSIVASVVGGLPVDVAGFVAVLVLLCAYTVVFGRFFCGFACAFGMLGDVLYQAGTFVFKLLGKKRRAMDPALEDKLRNGKFVVLVLLLMFTAAGASSVVTAVGPWTAFGRLVALQPAQMGIVATVVLVVLCAFMVAKERGFCEFLCPLGAVFALLPQLPSARMSRDMGACTECASCQHACPVGIYPPGDGAQMGECIACERCSAVCPAHCVQAGKQHPQAPKRIVRAAVLAALLLALLWACGSTSYLPSFQDTFFPEPAESEVAGE